MNLVLEIEHLLGVAFAAISPANSAPDWPPQPDRIFSALVAAWGARGEHPDERHALAWLEEQPVPEIAASGGFARTTAIAFVPPNDPQSARTVNRAVMPDYRSRQPRRFPAFRPDDPRVQLVWRNVDVDDNTLSNLNALAAHTAYIGHSASVTRCRFSVGSGSEDTVPAKRRVYQGRLAQLEHDYAAGRRPQPGEIVRRAPSVADETPRSAFADRWLVLEHVDGTMPDLRGCALVAKALRNALMSGYKASGREQSIPAVVSGHAADGSPSADPHLAIVPLAFVGSRYADGHVLGFALVPPDDGALLDQPEFQDAVRNIAKWQDEPGRRELKLTANGFDLTFSVNAAVALRSLDPRPYVAVARTWATCTPVVLDRHLKATGNAARDAEIAELIRQACVHAGLPAPPRVAPGKHSAMNGAPPTSRSRRVPKWTGWRVPTSLASRQLTHAILQFEAPVRGPVIIGAGRFAGLGLCRPLDARGVA